MTVNQNVCRRWDATESATKAVSFERLSRDGGWRYISQISNAPILCPERPTPQRLAMLPAPKLYEHLRIPHAATSRCRHSCWPARIRRPHPCLSPALVRAKILAPRLRPYHPRQRRRCFLRHCPRTQMLHPLRRTISAAAGDTDTPTSPWQPQPRLLPPSTTTTPCAEAAAPSIASQQPGGWRAETAQSRGRAWSGQ
jgi:hypothetical protein